ncbi:Fumitremorgin C synthase [Colletotrichum sp. SAR11_59]|uniref:Cytochrome n=1 Tax=Colletotrichum asianum TaxID=702518 RepID=A0A8H3WBK9_9PEZI|nr:cytochrome [Colletotrichum asianum]KAI8300316.1 Fumitremorgin C synthase [Colletotrichum sp. SAR11_59]
MAVDSTLAVLVAVALLTGLFLTSRRAKNDRPPKPLKLPIIGDLHSSPIERPMLNWDAWTRAQGPVGTPKLFGIMPFVVLNTAEAATELFGKRSALYSNRPSSVSMEMITDSSPGKSRMTLMHDYDAHLKLHHRMLSPSLGALAAPRVQPLMELESRQLLRDAVNTVQGSGRTVMSSTELYPLLERTQASVILGLHYGIRVPAHSDPLFTEILHVQHKVTYVAANPSLVDFIPPLRHLPAIISPWHRAANKLFVEQRDLYLRLVEIAMNEPGWNATKQARAIAAKNPDTEAVPDLDLAFTLATSISGGMETSPRQTLWLLVAAHANPGFVAKAHAVLDQFVGRDRLPRFADRSNLVYIDAIVSEVVRWRPIAPGSIPRRADREDEIFGTPIVKGATLFANAWAIGRDEKVFDESLGDLDSYVPERWLDEEGKLRTDLPLAGFGHGRRSCLGKRVALDNTFMIVASLLWAFEVAPVGQVDSMAMEVAGFMTAPSEFKFSLKPRGKWVQEVIQREWDVSETDLSKLMGPWVDVETS